ncbi:tetratricopeptide repeat protein [Planctomycetota bacterium]
MLKVSSVTPKALHQKWTKAVKTNDIKAMLKTGGRLLQALKKPHSSFALHRIGILEQLAELKFQAASYRDAGAYYYALRHIDTRLYGSLSLEVFQDDVHLGEIAFAQRAITTALKIYKKILKQAGQLLGNKNPYFAILLNNLGGVYYAKKDFVQARKLYEQSLKINRLNYKKQHKSVAVSFYNLGLVCEAQGQKDDAAINYQKACQISKKVMLPHDPTFTVIVNKCEKTTLEGSAF